MIAARGELHGDLVFMPAGILQFLVRLGPASKFRAR
jgi:hypothetical protein